MADSSEFRVGVIGAILEVQFVDSAGDADDVSTATVRKIRIKLKGGRTAKEFTASFTTDGTDGKIRYVTIATTDIPLAGTWEIQGYLEMTGGWKGWGPAGEFTVGQVLGPLPA